MVITPAALITFPHPWRCPDCGVGVLPHGRMEPFVVDESGVYCREHGEDREPAIRCAVTDYKTGLKAQRLAALRRLEQQIGSGS